MLPYMLNFDLKKIADLNLKGLKDYEDAKLNRKENKKITRRVIDSDDILILRFIYTMGKETKTVRDKSDKDFFWVKYESLFEEYKGLLLINKSALNTRLNKYVEMGLIERKCVKNNDGSFSFFKLTGVSDLIYIAVDSNGNQPVEGQVHFEEVIEENETVEICEESKQDFELRVEQIERVLTTKANRKLKSQLSRFKNQYEFFDYFDNFIVPQIEKGKKNTCDYMVRNVKLYLDGELK